MKNRTPAPSTQALPLAWDDPQNGFAVNPPKQEEGNERQGEKARTRAAIATWTRLHGGTR